MSKLKLRQELLRENDIQAALTYIQQMTDCRPKLALVLGSGLGDFATKVNAEITIPASEIPYYPVSSVQGHAGKLIFGFLQRDSKQSLPLLIFQGRVHYYENKSIDQVVFPIVLAHKLGIKKLIVTNAAGGINESYVAGDLMLIKDVFHFTFLQFSSLKRELINPSLKHLKLFDSELQQTTLQCALEHGIPLNQGTYCWLKGPSYETVAEIKMLKYIGADAVGMSTVPEIYTAKRLGIKAVGISLISNMAAGISITKLSHREVTATANQVKDKFSLLMENLIYSIK